jgi:Ca-activated chloride channel family protein
LRSAYDQNLAEQDQDPIAINLLYSRSHLAIVDESQIVYTMLDFSAVQRFASQHKPSLNVCLVLDRSTSMQGVRMDTVKTAAIELVRQLKAEDVLSIVTFSDRAEVLVSAARQQDRSSVETQVQMMRASGGTEIYQGLEAAFREVSKNLAKSLINHIILVTDGRTYGDEDACLQLANRAAHQGIRITGLGIGTEWNDVFLDELTGQTGGSSFFISRASDIHTFLQDKFNSLNDIFAERVSLKLSVPENVRLVSGFRIQPEPAVLSNTMPIRLGSIPKSTNLSILLEMIVLPFPADTFRLTLASGDLSLVLPFDPSKLLRFPVGLTRLTSSEVITEIPPKPIFQALSQINLYRMQDRARAEVAEGKVQEASQRLQRLATQLLAMGENELAQTALMEAERIQQTHTFSAEGEKRIKYGTRAFLLPARVEGE